MVRISWINRSHSSSVNPLSCSSSVTSGGEIVAGERRECLSMSRRRESNAWASIEYGKGAHTESTSSRARPMSKTSPFYDSFCGYIQYTRYDAVFSMESDGQVYLSASA